MLRVGLKAGEPPMSKCSSVSPAKPNLWKEQGGVESVSDVGGREESGQGKHVTSEEGGRGVNSPLCEGLGNNRWAGQCLVDGH